MRWYGKVWVGRGRCATRMVNWLFLFILNVIWPMPRCLCSQASKEADYLAVGGRIVRVFRSRVAIEEFLIRDVIDLTWEVLAFGVSRP